MANRKHQNVISSEKSNFNRHKSHCSICRHAQREEIEREFISWKSPEKIATEYKLPDRTALYRHAHAVDLFSRRDRNLRAALGRLIERVDEVEATAGAVVQAITLLGRINARGELVSRDVLVGLHELFAKMTRDELEVYAKGGPLPSWFPQVEDTKGPQSPGGDQNA